MNGSTETLRLTGVETLENNDPRKIILCYGIAAAAFTKSLITKQDD